MRLNNKPHIELGWTGLDRPNRNRPLADSMTGLVLITMSTILVVVFWKLCIVLFDEEMKIQSIRWKMVSQRWEAQFCPCTGLYCLDPIPPTWFSLTFLTIIHFKALTASMYQIPTWTRYTSNKPHNSTIDICRTDHGAMLGLEANCLLIMFKFNHNMMFVNVIEMFLTKIILSF